GGGGGETIAPGAADDPHVPQVAGQGRLADPHAGRTETAGQLLLTAHGGAAEDRSDLLLPGPLRHGRMPVRVGEYLFDTMKHYSAAHRPLSRPPPRRPAGPSRGPAGPRGSPG